VSRAPKGPPDPHGDTVEHPLRRHTPADEAGDIDVEASRIRHAVAARLFGAGGVARVRRFEVLRRVGSRIGSSDCEFAVC
jgi:hypothetical protein